MWQALIPVSAGAAMGVGSQMFGKKRNFRSIGQAALEGGMGGMGFSGMGGNSSMAGGLSNAFLKNFMSNKMGRI